MKTNLSISLLALWLVAETAFVSSALAGLDDLRSIAWQQQKQAETDRPRLKNRSWQGVWAIKVLFDQKPNHCERGGADAPQGKGITINTPGLLRVSHYGAPRYSSGGLVVRPQGQGWQSFHGYFEYSGVWGSGLIPDNNSRTEGLHAQVVEIKKVPVSLEIGIKPNVQALMGACGGQQERGLNILEVSFAPDQSVAPKALGYQLYFNGNLVSGPDAAQYTFEQAQKNCQWNRASKPNIAVRCIYNGTEF